MTTIFNIIIVLGAAIAAIVIGSYGTETDRGDTGTMIRKGRFRAAFLLQIGKSRESITTGAVTGPGLTHLALFLPCLRVGFVVACVWPITTQYP
jgi:hypothetical protein